MSFLRRLLGGRPPERRAPSVPLDPDLARIYARVALPALERQLAFQDRYGDPDWLLDQDAGTLRLDREVLPVGLIGTTSEITWTWRWAWANESIDQRLTGAVRQLREIGERDGVEALVRPDIPVGDPASGHTIAMIASGLLELDAYFRGPYEVGAVYLAVRLPPEERVERPSDARAAAVIDTSLTLSVPVPASSMRPYLESIGWRSDDAGTPRSPTGSTVRIERDELDRVTSLDWSLAP